MDIPKMPTLEDLSKKGKIDCKKIQEISLEGLRGFTERVQAVKSVEQKKPSEARIKEIKNNLEEIANIFQDAQVHYVIDGALNISLYGNEFFREHRDIDLGVFSADLPKLATTLEKKGYAIFKFPKNVNERLERDGMLVHELIRPDDIDVAKISRDRLMFLRVNDNLEIDIGNYEVFDIHALDQNENGDIVRLNGTVIPQEYYLNAPKYKTDSEKYLPLCHPIVLAYQKLLEGRDHDLADIEYMLEKGMLTKEDFSKIDDLLAQDEKSSWDAYKPKIKKAREWISLHR
jgi:hypothetical protein